jgi:hypothetical protein
MCSGDVDHGFLGAVTVAVGHDGARAWRRLQPSDVWGQGSRSGWCAYLGRRRPLRFWARVMVAMVRIVRVPGGGFNSWTF